MYKPILDKWRLTLVANLIAQNMIESLGEERKTQLLLYELLAFRRNGDTTSKEEAFVVASKTLKDVKKVHKVYRSFIVER